MHAFLSNLADRQRDRQTRANAFTSSFVGGNKLFYVKVFSLCRAIVCSAAQIVLQHVHRCHTSAWLGGACMSLVLPSRHRVGYCRLQMPMTLGRDPCMLSPCQLMTHPTPKHADTCIPASVILTDGMTDHDKCVHRQVTVHTPVEQSMINVAVNGFRTENSVRNK